MRNNITSPSILVFLAVLFYQNSCVQSDEPTNVIIVMTDDQGYGEIASHGNPWIDTPYLDQLRAESTRFTDFHVSPTCSPTRAALLTGHYSNRTGVWHTIAGRSLLRENEVTIADIFSQNGYETGIFGKWHLGDNYPFRPQDRGFKKTVVNGGGGVGQQPDTWGNDYFNDVYLHDGKPEKFNGYCTDIWFDHALAFIKKHQGKKPFFTYLTTNAPHGPFNVSDSYRLKYSDNSDIANPAFYGMIENIDDNMGRLLAFLKESGLEKNTILIFLTDNGTAAGVRFNKNREIIQGFNAGMRGIKGSEYEGGHRVPFYIRWPDGNIEAGRDIMTLASHIDVLPTLIDLLKLDSPKELQFDGQSLKTELYGNEDLEENRTIVTDSQREEFPQKWKKSATMRGKWRLINGNELYNVADDPAQKNDLAIEQPEMVRELREDYETWWSDIEGSFQDTPLISICPPEESVTILNIHDMHLDMGFEYDMPWNQSLLRAGKKCSGWWAVNVKNAGRYRLTFYRWPPEIRIPIGEEVPPTLKEPDTNWDGYETSNPRNIRQVHLQTGDFSAVKNVNLEAIGVSFEADLLVGAHKIRGKFIDDTSVPFAPNYIKVEKI